MAKTACELIWLTSLASELGFSVKEPMKMLCDNQAAVCIASNPMFHERTKHIEVDCHFFLFYRKRYFRAVKYSLCEVKESTSRHVH